MPNDENQGSRIKGLFSRQAQEKVGTGTTTRVNKGKTYLFAQERGDGKVEIQPLNDNNVPAGPKTVLSKDQFLEEFRPEPEYYLLEVFPRIQELEKRIEKGEEQRRKGAYYSAEFEFNGALEVDVENVRANFGLGLTYLSKGQTDKADDILGRLVRLDAAFAAEHKHLFNEFGISLRKSGLHDQAVQYYSRAMEMADHDENLHYNLARALYAKGDLAGCAEHLNAALEINPKMSEAKKFRNHLDKLTAQA
ncbi:MAG: tetratricopeptide repeat protein [Desulfovibrionaceae bacterium]|nr:tetratricopeptide repeat protein [Desulfovibrionaceae bacterium]